jgi:hypothetical protein
MNRGWWSRLGVSPAVLEAVRDLDDEAREEASARAQLTHWQVLAAGLQAELRQRNRAYGRASAEIGRLRGVLALVREQLRDQPVGFLLADRWGNVGVVDAAHRYGDEIAVEPRDPDTITWTEVRHLAIVLNHGDRALDGAPSWDELAEESRRTYMRLAQHVLRAGWRGPSVAVDPAPLLEKADGR